MGFNASIRVCGILAVASLFGTLLTAETISFQMAEIAQPQSRAEQLWKEGWEQYQAQQFQAAIATWQEVLQLYQQQDNPRNEALILNYLGLVRKTLGDYEQAIETYQQQLAIAQEISAPEIEAQAWSNLANAYRVLGKYADAIAANQKALEILQELGDRRGEGQVLGNLGNVYIELGNYDKAKELHQQSLQVARELRDRLAELNSLNSLGAIDASARNYESAKQSYRASLELAGKLNLPIAQANALNNLGTIHHSLKELEEAISYYEQTLEIARQLKNSGLMGSALTGLGVAHATLQNYSQALEYNEQGWEMAKEMGKRPLESIALGNWGYTLWKAGNLPAAEEKLREAIAARESLRLGLEDADNISIFDTQARTYNLLQQVLVAQGRTDAALEIAERGRSRAFVELLARRMGDRNDLDKLQVAPPTLEEIRQIAKAQNATLVEYAIITDEDFIGQGKLKGKAKKLFIWAIAPTGETTFEQVDLAQFMAEGKSLQDVVARGRMSIGVGGRGLVTVRAVDETQQTSHLQELHQLLIEPIAAALPADPDAKVIFIPHQALFLVPFPALQDERDRYLIEKHAMLAAPSIQVLQLTRERMEGMGSRESGVGEALIVGNPTMPSIPDEKGQLSPLNGLPGAEKEAIAIAQLLKAEAWTGDRATEAAVTQAMKNARLIHLATHGLLDDFGTGVPGAIALAPSEGVAPQLRILKPNDGLLSAEEIVQMNLAAELVVLSACDTGRGEITGDGVIGLSRSFIAAGVPSLIVSLWQVPDQPTADLMSEFYRQLQQNPDKARALRQAMLMTKEKHSNPRDWAAFLLVGESQ